jgi:hypothetical protein
MFILSSVHGPQQPPSTGSGQRLDTSRLRRDTWGPGAARGSLLLN